MCEPTIKRGLTLNPAGEYMAFFVYKKSPAVGDFIKVAFELPYKIFLLQ